MDDPRADSRVLTTRRRLAGILAGAAGLGVVASMSPRARAQATPGVFVPDTPTATPVIASPADTSAPTVITLYSEIDEKTLPFGELEHVATVLNTQLTRDFAPVWGRTAVVTAVPLKTPLPSQWWLEVQESPTQGSIGHVSSHPNGSGPWAIVPHLPATGWSREASHECLEMIVNPYNNAYYVMPSFCPRQNDVLYSVEVCDPVSTEAQAYVIDGLLVSDFVTPRYFDPDPAAIAGVKYSFRGNADGPLGMAIAKSRTKASGGYAVAPGGYQNWQTLDEKEHWRATRQDWGLQLCQPHDDGTELCGC